MCWKGKNIQHIVKNGEIINVIKIVKVTDDGIFVPYFWPHCGIIEYKSGETYQQFISPITYEYNSHEIAEIHEGLHSYMAKKVTIVTETPDGKICNTSLNYDVYQVRVYEKYDRLVGVIHPLQAFRCNRLPIQYPQYYHGSTLHLALLTGHLPTGAKYYVNNYGEVVSNMLVVDAIRPFMPEIRFRKND